MAATCSTVFKAGNMYCIINNKNSTTIPECIHISKPKLCNYNVKSGEHKSVLTAD